MAMEIRSKGQMFIIGAIFIIVVIVLIRNMIGTFELTEENRFQETRVIDKNLKNIQNEFRTLASVAAVQQDANQSGMDYLRNMSTQLRTDMDAKILYIYIMSNATNNKYSVTIGNYLQDRVNITFSPTNSNPGGRLLIVQDKSNITREYNASLNGTINVNVTYTSQSPGTTEQFNITVNTKNNIFLFTDITLRSNDFFIRGKDTYNWSWPV